MLAATEGEAQGAGAKATGAEKPRLVVCITVDQLRSDYIERFMPLFGSDGLRRLLSQGTVYANARYPFLPIDRASASATIACGATPSAHGITGTEWISRKTTQPIVCTEEAGTLLTPRGSAATPANLLASTIGDEMKIASLGAAKVYSIATQADAAVMLAGHTADAALWIDPKTGQWTTSAYYQRPSLSWVETYNRTNTAARKEKSATYVFNGDTRHADFALSPLVNADVTALAIQCVASASLGSDATPDLLAVQFYAGGYPATPTVGGTGTQLRDTYTALDRAVARLVTSVEQRVGHGRTLFILTSTGYAEEKPMDYAAARIPSGTVYINRTASLLNMYLAAMYGQGQYVEAYHDNHIYLDHKFIEQRKLRLGEVLDRSREMLILSDGIRDAHTTFTITSPTSDEARLLRGGYHTQTCGDLTVDLAPGWQLLNEDTHRTQPQRLTALEYPIILYGADITPKVVEAPVTADRIAPTIAHAIHIRAPNACNSLPLR